jgi:hypothetical protein
MKGDYVSFDVLSLQVSDVIASAAQISSVLLRALQ